jgi:hypothetical protein
MEARSTWTDERLDDLSRRMDERAMLGVMATILVSFAALIATQL